MTTLSTCSICGTTTSRQGAAGHATACRLRLRRASLPRGDWRAPDDAGDAIIESIDKVLASRGWTWADLRAWTAGSRQQSHQWLTGRNGMSVASLVAIADALGVPPGELLRGLS